MKTYTPVYFIKKLLIFLMLLIPVSIFIMNLTVVKAEDNKPFIKVPNDEWPSQVIFDTVQVCYQGTLRWVATGNPNLMNTPPPYHVARVMTIHCFCVLDKLRTAYKFSIWTKMLFGDNPMEPVVAPREFMEKAIYCIRDHNTLAGVVLLDQDTIDKFLNDNETKNNTKIEVKPPDNNSGESDSTPEQPKELPTEDAPLLNF